MPATVELHLECDAYNDGNYAGLSTESSQVHTTILEALNEVLESVTEFPVDAVPDDSTGQTIQARALRFLERANTRVQSLGWPENTYYSQDKTVTQLAAYDMSSTDPNNTFLLGISSAGKDSHRQLSLVRNSSTGAVEVYDSDTNKTLTGSSSVTVNVILKRRFSMLSPALQALVIRTAAQEMQRRIKGSMQADQALGQERGLAETGVAKNNSAKKNAILPNSGQ